MLQWIDSGIRGTKYSSFIVAKRQFNITDEFFNIFRMYGTVKYVIASLDVVLVSFGFWGHFFLYVPVQSTFWFFSV